ncbi:MAG: murein L,D-transpeptidase [Verrucomicrobiaceae bacterium]|nr:murein L,D-transpeptidase [Verrucomicrobiaceae bacterium]
MVLLLGLWLHPATQPYARLAMRRMTFAALTLPYPLPPESKTWKTMSAAQRLTDVKKRLQGPLEAELAKSGLQLGQAAYIRLFKESSEFELWLKSASGAWKLFRTYPIAVFSGGLGPKQKEGDMQAPEGCYGITRGQLNPASNYHLAFNIGYPDALDRHHGRTGSLIMVHGDQVSIGCFAMTDPVIEEIYLIIEASLNNGQTTISLHAFPFRMTPQRIEQAASDKSPWLSFWNDLRVIHDAFERTHRPPLVSVSEGRYQVK